MRQTGNRVVTSLVDSRTGPDGGVRGPHAIGAIAPGDMAELHRLCREGRLYEVQTWIKEGRPLQLAEGVSTQGSRHATSALQIALERGNHSLTELLLSNGCDPNRDEGSPLDEPLRTKRMDLVDLLLEWGADPNDVDVGDLFATYQSGLSGGRESPQTHTIARGSREVWDRVAQATAAAASGYRLHRGTSHWHGQDELDSPRALQSRLDRADHDGRAAMGDVGQRSPKGMQTSERAGAAARVLGQSGCWSMPQAASASPPSGRRGRGDRDLGVGGGARDGSGRPTGVVVRVQYEGRRVPQPQGYRVGHCSRLAAHRARGLSDRGAGRRSDGRAPRSS